MSLPITIPYTFGSSTTAIPLSNLDSDYQTVYYAVNGLGNGSVALANVAITGGTVSGNTTLSNVTISSVSTPITPAQGGTGATSLTANSVVVGNGTSQVAVVAPGTSGNVLTSNGTNWISQAAGAASGNVTYGNATVSLGGSSANIGNITLANVTVQSGAITANVATSTIDGTNTVGFLNIPQNAQTGSYTLVLADAGKHIYHASGAGAATYTIPAASSVAYPIGTAITFINLSATSISIAITTDTMYLSSAGTTGTRTLAQYGSATAIKVSGLSSSGIWVISGSGLT